MKTYFIRAMRIAMLSASFVIGAVKIADAQYLEQVHLKNGSVIRGIITEQIPNVNLKIQTADGSIFVYNYDEIEKISKDYTNKTTSNRSLYQQKALYKDSRTPRYEGGVSSTIYVMRPFTIGLNTTHGCLISPYIYIGAGAGLNYFIEDGALSLPVFGDVRVYFMKGDIKPYVNIRAGYDVLLNGINAGASLGLRYKLFDLSIGYQMLRCTVNYGNYGYYRQSIHNLSVNIGVRF